jgi:ribokinase
VAEALRVDVAVVGTINLDRMIRVHRLPKRGETVEGAGVLTTPGGKGTNQAVAAARLGASSALIGCVGDDAAADQVLDFLGAEPRLDVAGVRHVAGATGTAAITVDRGGGNTVVSVRGANASLDEEHVHRYGAIVGGAKALLTQPGVPIEAVRAALEIARSVGTLTVLDPAPADAITDDLIRLADVLTPNATEAATLTGIPVRTLDDARAASSVLLRKGCASVVVTLAELGAVYAAADGTTRVVAPVAVEVVDPTAAGDAFAGALAASLARGDSMDDALLDAAAAGALTASRAGAAASLPTRADVIAARERSV